MSHIQASQGPQAHSHTHTHTCPSHIVLPPSFTHLPFSPSHPTHPPSLSHAQSRPRPTHTSLPDNPSSGHPQGGRLGSSGSTGLLYSFPSPRQDTPGGEHPCPERVTSHTPQGHRHRLRETHAPQPLRPPKDTYHPLPLKPSCRRQSSQPRASARRGGGPDPAKLPSRFRV